VNIKGKTASLESLPVAMKPLNIAIIGPSERWIGGQGVQAGLLLRHWQNDPAICVCFIPIDPEIPGPLGWIRHIPVLRTLVRTPFYLRALWRGTRGADIVHIFSASYWSFLLAPLPAWITARLRRKKTIIHYHSGEARDHLRRSAIARRVLRACDRIVVPSQYLADVFAEFDLRTETVPNIVDLTQFSHRSRDVLRPRLICTRGFHHYYRVDLVVRAFQIVKNQYPDARLCLVGQGPLRREIEELVGSLGLSDVEFTGPIAHASIAGYYDQNDIFINASWLDNMPVSILEAFAAGTPVVTTAPESIRYLVEHDETGLVCEPGDWQSLGDNVLRLLSDQGLGGRLAANANKISQSYRWAIVREQWLRIYHSLSDDFMVAMPSSAPKISNSGALGAKSG
jgi:glycosyltransferase involved in cell wall biosynthesis